MLFVILYISKNKTMAKKSAPRPIVDVEGILRLILRNAWRFTMYLIGYIERWFRLFWSQLIWIGDRFSEANEEMQAINLHMALKVITYVLMVVGLGALLLLLIAWCFLRALAPYQPQNR